MAHRIIWSDISRDDLRDIVCYIALDNPERAQSFGCELMSQADDLQEFPEIGRVVPELTDNNIREIVFGSYRIIYRIKRDDNLVEMIRIWHGARGAPSIS